MSESRPELLLARYEVGAFVALPLPTAEVSSAAIPVPRPPLFRRTASELRVPNDYL
jgi:hypothetical protein